MTNLIGIRREDKNRWERRTPLVPNDMAKLIPGISFVVQASPLRAFSDDDFRAAKAEVRDDLRGVPVVLGVKEMPLDTFEPNGVYVFFSHTIKGQPDNMPLLRRLAELGCTLIDYERITDEKDRRLVFFGKWAGTAGMIDSLWALGKRLQILGFDTPLEDMLQTWRYDSLAHAQEAVTAVGRAIRGKGLPAPLRPLTVAFLGYGNVSKGAQEILDFLPVEEVAPSEVAALAARADAPGDRIFKAVYTEEDLVLPRKTGSAFDLPDYYRFPDKYRGTFYRHLPHLSMVMNCIYWDGRYPRFILQQDLERLFESQANPRLKVIGDISCDVHGSVEICVRVTEPDNPVFLFDPLTGEDQDGLEGRGVAVLAVDNLPCELPIESSTEFSSTVREFLPALAAQDFTVPFDELDLPDPLRRAVILHRGELTPPFGFMESFLKGGQDG